MSEAVLSNSFQFLSLLPYFWTLLTSVLVAWGGILFKTWLDNKTYKNKILHDQMRALSQRYLDALQYVWGLLQYMTEVENNKSIVVWVKEGDDKTFYIRRANAEEFIYENLPAIFYQEGAGLFLGKNVKESLYEYRSLIYGVLVKDKSNSEKIIIENQELPIKIKKIYDDLNKILKQHIEHHSSYSDKLLSPHTTEKV